MAKGVQSSELKLKSAPVGLIYVMFGRDARTHSLLLAGVLY